MKTVVIENPILNSPFEMPRRHFKFDENGITDEVADSRRPSSYFIPIAGPKKKGKQLAFDTTWTQDRAKENDINFIRSRVGLWRDQGHPGITPVTRSLLEYWTRPDRERRLFFCQVEALETLIYLAVAAEKSGDTAILTRLQEAAAAAGTSLPRLTCKMATGTGKTVLMAMLIAWQTLNRLAYPSSGRFADAFLIVSPGITIRDRLRVLLPSDPNSYYRLLDLAPVESLADLGTAKIVITNYHAFKAKDRGDAGKLTKSILAGGKASAFTETPAQVVRRVCRKLGNKRNIIVINDEAHHCYRSRPAGEPYPAANAAGSPSSGEPAALAAGFEKLTGDDRKEAEQREEAARLWINGLEAVQEKVGVKAVYDLSARPFYLRGSGYPEGTLFPWVASDFSLIDAIESGIVKIPRVPVADDAMTGNFPTYRDLWYRIREVLPKKGRGASRLRKLPDASPDPAAYAAGSPNATHPAAVENPAAYAAGSPTQHDIRRGFVYKRVPHVTLKSIANNPDIHEGMSREQIDAAIRKHADTESLYDQPYEDKGVVRVTGPFTVESLSPHRMLPAATPHPAVGSHPAAHAAGSPQAAAPNPAAHAAGSPNDYLTTILDNLRKSGVQNTVKKERLAFDRLDTFPGEYIQAEGTYTENGASKAVRVSVGPEFGTVGPEWIKLAALEAIRGSKCDLLLVCGFAFDPHVSGQTEELKKEMRFGKVPILAVRMTPDLAMGDELLKKTGSGNLFMVFGEPDIALHKQKDGRLTVELRGVDVYDPTSGEVRSHSTDDIACWFLDTDYNDESFFVRHAYFCGGDEPYEKLKKSLRAEIDESEWSKLYATRSLPFEAPKKGKIAVKVINHYGDEVLKVFRAP